MSTQDGPPAEIVYGEKAIGKVTNEPNPRKNYHRLENGYYEGAFKCGRTWALNVPVYRKSIGLEP
jgi:hypothetical protein